MSVSRLSSCVRCDGHSSSKEAFTNLSLDLEPEGSVSQALDRYLTVSDFMDPSYCRSSSTWMLLYVDDVVLCEGNTKVCVVFGCVVGELSGVYLPVRCQRIWHAALLPDPAEVSDTTS